MGDSGLNTHIPDTLIDKNGQTYTLWIVANTQEDFDLSILRVDDREVGSVKCSIEWPDLLLIHDLNIYDWVFTGESWLVRRLRQWFHLKGPRTNYQRLGLGSQLLDVVIAHAKQIGIHRIAGQISARDRRLNPNLYKFYKDHGFEIIEYDDPMAFVAKIELILEPSR